ncbi:hypothetical protein BV898_00293 [Hypsibius exemplaris]|nr:hypothetical protein BV898_00293 [Hypsibius exemplaris]
MYNAPFHWTVPRLRKSRSGKDGENKGRAAASRAADLRATVQLASLVDGWISSRGGVGRIVSSLAHSPRVGR